MFHGVLQNSTPFSPQVAQLFTEITLLQQSLSRKMHSLRISSGWSLEIDTSLVTAGTKQGKIRGGNVSDRLGSLTGDWSRSICNSILVSHLSTGFGNNVRKFCTNLVTFLMLGWCFVLLRKMVNYALSLCLIGSWVRLRVRDNGREIPFEGFPGTKGDSLVPNSHIKLKLT